MDFNFTLLVNDPHADIVSACLGVNAAGKFAQADVGKPVKMGTAQNYVLCSAGNDIEGFVYSVSPETANDGFSFGSVLRNTRVLAEVDAVIDGTVNNEAVAVLEYAIAGTSAALGTAEANGYPKIRDGVPANKNNNWRIIRMISGAGLAGSVVLLEKE